MPIDTESDVWSAAVFALIEAQLWRDNEQVAADLSWLTLTWKEPAAFWRGLHAHWKRLQVVQTRSTTLLCYDFYHDLIGRQKHQPVTAYGWFDGKMWQTRTYAEVEQGVNGLAATWETLGVQAGETLAILHPPGWLWLLSLLAGLRLGLVISLIPPQGDAFVQRRLENLSPQWLAMDSLYRHRLAAVWQKTTLPNTLSTSPPQRQPHLYPGNAIVVYSFDPTSATPDLPCAVDANCLYLSALRDGVLSLGIKRGQRCAAPDWHRMESQPALVLAVLLSGGTWLDIEWAAIEKDPECLSLQVIDIIGITRRVRDVLRRQPLRTEQRWRYWFRHPAEATDLTLWQDFIQKMQLQDSYVGNLLWNATLGGAILFSTKCRGQAHQQATPAAGMIWQLGQIVSPDLPCLDGSGRMAVGKLQEEEIMWTATPHIIAFYLETWHYLGNYPRGRAGRTYPREEILAVLSGCESYLALIEAPLVGGNADSRQVLLVFAKKTVDKNALQQCIETQLGSEFLPDRIEALPLLPKRNDEGAVDQAWCQFHYVSGELYRRQHSPLYRCLSEFKKMLLV